MLFTSHAVRGDLLPPPQESHTPREAPVAEKAVGRAVHSGEATAGDGRRGPQHRDGSEGDGGRGGAGRPHPAPGPEEKLGHLQAELGGLPKGQPADASRSARRDRHHTSDARSGGKQLASF